MKITFHFAHLMPLISTYPLEQSLPTLAQDAHVRIWHGCLATIQQSVGEQSFNTWFRPIVPLQLKENVLIIQVPSHFFFEWLEEHFVEILRRAIHQELGKDGRLEYSIIMDKASQTANQLSIKIPAAPPAPKPHQFDKFQAEVKGPSLNDVFSGQLASQYNFDNYVEGDCNRLARAAGMAVADRPGYTSFNPLMIYGGVGLGKTHLIQAIGNEVRLKHPDKKVIYVSSEHFTNQFIETLRSNRAGEFIQFFTNVDVLIIDDVQFLAGKEKTQDTFFHIFNHLQQCRKQIIMTSDCPPRDLKGMHERLLSRFKWGLTADIQRPDFETRVAIIQTKMQADGVYLPTDVVEYLAKTVDTNIRELEGVLISLMAQSSLVKRDFDLSLAKQILQNIISDIEEEVGIEMIEEKVSEYFDVPADQLKAKTRKKEIVIARQVAMYFAKEYTDFSLKSIGEYFGGRDHSTVIHAIQAVNELIDTNKNFKTSIQELQNRFPKNGD